jgi:uncharacterized membrane protein (DUF2068 family)
MTLARTHQFKVKIVHITQNRRKGLVAICVLAILQSAMRFIFPIAIVSGIMDQTQNATLESLLAYILVAFIALGIAGIITTYGLWMGKRWGFTGTIYLSAATIVFDIWGVVFVQGTAALGLILPVVFIVYLIMIRNDFAAEGKRHEGARGIRN